MLKTRRCHICKNRLAGKKGHGFVINNGRTLICGDYKRHNRLKYNKKWTYGSDEQEASELTHGS